MSIEPFIPKNIRSSKKLVVSITNIPRIVLTKELRRFLDCDGKPIDLILGYDRDREIFTIAKPEDIKDDIPPTRFGPNGYISARKFVDQFDIPYENGPIHYIYTGKENGWMLFKKEGSE